MGTSGWLSEDGSITSSPLSGASTRTPMELSISRVISTSPIGGTLVRVVGVSASNAATITLGAKFFAPRHWISPTIGCPPSMRYASVDMNKPFLPRSLSWTFFSESLSVLSLSIHYDQREVRSKNLYIFLYKTEG